ncbi:MAG: NAD-dependent 4,6-dehydratase LegB [Rhodospirillaceae bacterium]
MKSRTILVTGADGFIGSHLTEYLVRAGYSVRALVQYNSFNSRGWLDSIAPDVSAELDVMSGDVRDAYGVRQAVKGVDAIIHLAALIAIPYSYQSTAAYVDTNITGTLNLLQAARDFGVSRFIQTSTSEVYGTARFVPITEEHPLNAQSPYAATKIAADQLALSFHRSFGCPVTVLRPFNTYGPRQSARAVIPAIIIQILGGKRKLKLGALHPTRDFNYVADTVRGFAAALDIPAAEGEVINIGSNFEISILDTVRTIAEVIGAEIEIETDLQRLRPDRSEVERLWADNRKAAALLGWSPEYGGVEGFRRGIENTVDWFRQPANQACYKSDIYNL